MSWNDRLTLALRIRGVTKAELARACRIERASVTEWANGKTKDPKLVPFFLACDKLRIRPRWLALGEGPMELSDLSMRESLVETITQLAERLSTADQRQVLHILEDSIRH
jgi:transcriptional regulator with XRE-family HTH domain